MADSTTTTTTSAAPAVLQAVHASQEKAHAIVHRWMWWSMGAGLIPIPLADMAIVAGIQYKMLKDLSAAYEVEWHQNRVKSIVGVLLGAIIPTRIAQGKTTFSLRFVPVVGSIVGVLTEPLFCGASTYAVGKVFTQHFASGGTFLDFDPSKVAAFFQQQFQAGKAMLQHARGPAGATHN